MRLPAIALASALLAATSTATAQPTVRDERPRLLLGSGGLAVETFRARCTSDPAYSSRCSFGSAESSLYPAATHAAAYVVTGDASRCAQAFTRMMEATSTAPGEPDAHAFISDHGRTMPEVALALDWCWDALSESERAQVVERVRAYGSWYVENSPPDVFHDDMNNVWKSVALAGLVLAHTEADADAARFLAAAETQWKDVIMPALAYAGDWWHEGFTYVQPTIGAFAWTLAGWSTATDEDLYAYARDHGDLVEGYLRMHAYAMRPDARYVYVGDTADNKQSIELFSRWLVDMLTFGSDSPLGQALSLRIRELSRPGYDYAGASAWMSALLYDASRDASATPFESLETARWLGRGSEDVAVMRSGWDADDTYVFLSCGDYFSGHQHIESGSFHVYGAGAMLTGSTGTYDAFETDHWQSYYAQHSVHANTLAIVDPGEYFPTLQTFRMGREHSVNDGGQRPLRLAEMGDYRRVLDLPMYLTRRDGLPHYETGSIRTFEHGTCHDYVACDATAAYSSPGRVTDGNEPKVSEVTRQLVFLPPDVIVVFDRIESLDASFEKRFLLHTYGTLEHDGGAFRLENGEGALVGRTLLPASADTEVITAFEVAGTPHPPSSTGREIGGTRLEVSPTTERARDVFLHVLRVQPASDPAALEASATEDDTHVTLTLTTRSGEPITLQLAKTGDLGGHLTVGSRCDQELGETGAMPGDDAGAPSGRDGGTTTRADGSA
ncbi:MAG: heparinase II/III family protein, partial [Myxococcota bacterium]|nr:heparinase II/III family protein [Myxococcota bacterium]